MPKKDFPVIPPDRADDLHNLEIADSSENGMKILERSGHSSNSEYPFSNAMRSPR